MIATLRWLHLLSMRLLLSLLVIAGGISACIYRLQLRWLGSVLSGISGVQRVMAEGHSSYTTAHLLPALIFISLLISCLIFSRGSCTIFNSLYSYVLDSRALLLRFSRYLRFRGHPKASINRLLALILHVLQEAFHPTELKFALREVRDTGEAVGVLER